MYTAYQLTESSRQSILALFKPKYSSVICHHITVKFGVPSNAPLPPKTKDIQVVGYIDNKDGLEVLLVSIDGKTDRENGQKYHITLSIDRDKGYKPVDSNKVIEETKNIMKVNGLSIDAKPVLL